ncbi:MAG: hypothetical protein E7353_06460 [Clostridiales bacterium]|nr:hypothetical protein [Clostridiales bacterium]
MAQIHKLQNNADYYFDKGVSYSDNGEYTKAIDCFYRAYELDVNKDSADTLLEIGACYAMLGEHYSALKMYYRTLAIDAKNESAFVGIISSLIELNRNPEAIYYINYSDSKNIIGEDYDVSVTNHKNFKVVGKYDREATIYVARKLMHSGEYSYAKKLLEEVPPQSRDYIEALNLIAMIYLREEKFVSSALVCDAVLAKLPNDVNALTSKIVALHYANNIKERDEIIERLDDVNVTKEQDIKKVAKCMQQVKNEKYTLKYYKKLLDFTPYDKVANLLVAIIYHNMGKHSLAHSIMVKLAKLYPDCEKVKYFAINLREGNDKFDVVPDIPQSEQESWFDEINDTLSSLKTVERVANYVKKHSEFYDKLRWIITSPQVKIAGHISAFLAQSVYFHPLIRELLVNPDVNYYAKRECLAPFLEFAQKKNFAMFLQDVVQFFKPHQPKLKVSNELNTAYWRVYANCAFITTDFDKALNLNYKTFAKRIMELPSDKCDEFEVNELTAVFAFITKLHPIFIDKKAVCNLFEADEKKFDALLDLYNFKLEEKQ